MKTLMNLILLILLTTTTFSQVQSNCDRTWGLNEYYEQDITDLALTRLFEIQSPDTNQIVIPGIKSIDNGFWKFICFIQTIKEF